MKKIFRSIMAITIAAMTFTACEDVPAPYDIFADEQETDNPTTVAEGSGTQADPYNVAAVLEYVKSLGTSESTENVYVKGIVVAITEIAQGNFGNATYTISDDGTSNDVFTVYRSKYFNNKAFTSADQLAVGDEVVVVGKVVYYNGKTPEFVQNASYLYSRNGKTSDDSGNNGQTQGEAKGNGTLTDPYNATAAINLAKTLASGAESPEIYIKGKISSIKEEYNTNYGNGTFYISDDGTENGDQFYIFRALYLGNKKFVDGNTQIKKGDEVIICGKITNYQGNTPETVQNASFLYSLNGVSEGGNNTPAAQTHGTADAPVALSEVLSVINGLADGATTDDLYYVAGQITEIQTSDENIAKYKNIDYIISDGTNSIKVFRGKNFNNTDFTAAGQINVGDNVVVIGKLQKYVNPNTSEVVPEVAQGNYLVKLNGNTEGNGNGNGNNDTTDPSNVGTVNGNTITFAFSDFALANEADLTTLSLVDGTTITFAQNDGRNAPKYYTSGTAARMYALNSVTFTASKNISKVVLTCETDSRTGNETLYAEAGSNRATVARDGAVMTLTNIDNKSVKVVNDHTGNSGGTQLRIVSVEITYVE